MSHGEQDTPSGVNQQPPARSDEDREVVSADVGRELFEPIS